MIVVVSKNERGAKREFIFILDTYKKQTCLAIISNDSSIKTSTCVTQVPCQKMISLIGLL